MTRSNDIIFLFGAGASAEAGIPISAQMIDQLEQIVERTGRSALYNHVKSAIYFSAGIRGSYGHDVNYNIETLANTLYELERNEEHPSWNSRFVSLAGKDFCEIKKLRRDILEQLKIWVCPDDTTKGDYYSGLTSLQKDLNYPLHIFSLNYDLSIERLSSADFRVETGFEGSGPRFPWEWQRFAFAGDTSSLLPQVFLYKLHGSVNWKRDKDTKQLFSVDQVSSVDPDKMELIFGREFKMEAADPYLFFAYQFRILTLEARLIVVVGYGFGDTHINKMLSQSLSSDSTRRMLVVQRCQANEVDRKAELIFRALELSEDHKPQIVIQPGTAKEFLLTQDLAAALQAHLPAVEDAPF